ncbi:MAG TPA: type I secretion system permease/ATPase, partial [Gammaproteobacteria bacterium]
MTRPHAPPPMDDSGLACVVLLARLHDIAADAERLRHRFGVDGRLDEAGLRRALRALGLNSTALDSDPTRLADAPLPALARCADGRWVVVARCDGGRVLLQDPAQERPTLLARAEFGARWDGRLLLVARRHGLPGPGRGFGFGWFLPVLGRYRHLLGEVLLASLFLQLLGLATPLFFQVVVDKVLVHRGLTTLDVLAVGMLLLALFEATLGGLRGWLFAHTCARVDVELGARLFHHLLRLPHGWFLARRAGDTVARVRELESVRQFFTSSALSVVLDVAFSGVFLGVMWLYSPQLTLLVLALLPGYAALSLLLTPLLRRRIAERLERGADNHAFLVETVAGVETLKGMAVTPQLQRRWEEQLAAYVGSTFRTAQLGNLAGQGAALLSRLGTVAVLWLGARLVIDGALSVGQLVAFNLLAARVNGPVLRLVQLWQEFQQAGLSLRRLGDILDAPAEPGHGTPRLHPPRLRGRITLDRLRFRYRADGPDVLDGVSLEIAAGEVLGIVGRSGSGKSTLARLLLRLHAPTGGRLQVDGLDLALLDPEWLRQRIGVVPQEARLFNRSVRENIALAAPGLPLERVIRAAELAGAHEFIAALPDGYDTPVGEQGAWLSGGQRQRLALARALVTDPDVLILDEATSALDYESERAVHANLAEICRGRT